MPRVVIAVILILAVSLGANGQTAVVGSLATMFQRWGQLGDQIYCQCQASNNNVQLRSVVGGLATLFQQWSAQADNYWCRCIRAQQNQQPAAQPQQPQIIFLTPPPQPAQPQQPQIIFLGDQNQQAPQQNPIVIHQQQPQQQQPVIVQQQPAGQQNPIVIKLEQQPPVIIREEADEAPRPPQIAAQSLTPPPAPVATTEQDLASQVFVGEPPNMVTRCPIGTPISWVYKTWTVGSIRPYYENVGPRGDLEGCISVCRGRDDCYFATVAPSGTCFLLTTTHESACTYEVSGHFGRPLEHCSVQRPCPSAYRACSRPRCTLGSIFQTYCTTLNKARAVSTCTNQI